MNRYIIGILILLAAALAWMPRTAHAAESYDNCTGYITSLPATISAQGTWCLKQDLATAISSGNAITIAANNVTIDCNDFKIGDLAAGAATQAYGIYALNSVLNATVRHCNVRGFYYGLLFYGDIGGGDTVEDNRFVGNTYVAVAVSGEGSVIRRNLILDTGGSTVGGDAFGIYATYSVDILDNTISGVTALAGSGGSARGITTLINPNGSISGNRVRGVLKDGAGKAYGIFNNASDRVTVRKNDVTGDASSGSIGLHCETSNGRATDNVISGFATGIEGCSDDGNVVAP